MTFFPLTRYRYQHQLACGLLLLALVSCGNSSPPGDRSGLPPDTLAPARTTSANPSPAPPTLTPPGQVDRSQPTPDSVDQSSANPSANPDAAPIAAPNYPETGDTRTTGQGDSLRLLSCQTSGGLVNDPNAPLNVRSTPDTGSENVVGSLENGALVSIVGDQGNWWQIEAPTAGWVSKTLIDSTCNEKIARIVFPANTMSVTLSVRFFGTGYHHYQLEARAGQKLTLEALDSSSPLPFVLNSNNQDLTDGIGSTRATRWSGTLPADGNYTIVFDSNFRGYAYNIILSVE